MLIYKEAYLPVEWRLFGNGRRPSLVLRLRTRFSDLDDTPAGLDMHKMYIQGHIVMLHETHKNIFNMPLTHDAKLYGVANSTTFGVDRCARIAAGMRARDSSDNQTLFHNDDPSRYVFPYILSLMKDCRD